MTPAHQTDALIYALGLCTGWVIRLCWFEASASDRLDALKGKQP